MGLTSLPGETKLGDIVNNEYNRLKIENSSVSNLQQNKSRMSYFNDSYRKRYLDYIKIMIIIVVGLAILWILMVLESMQIIPSYINNFLVAIIISITLIICYLIYNDIQKHDSLNYDELSIKSPNLVTPNPDQNQKSTSNLDTNGKQSGVDSEKCKSSPPNQDMCGSGTTYDSTTQKCVGAMNLFK
jgi:hypothetical protein